MTDVADGVLLVLEIIFVIHNRQPGNTYRKEEISIEVITTLEKVMLQCYKRKKVNGTN